MDRAEQHLQEIGFDHHVSDEPHEDHWLYEGVGGDLLAERTSEGWSLAREPGEFEPQGSWIDVAIGLSPEALRDEVDFLIGPRPPRAVIVDTEYTTWPGALESGWSTPGQHREIVQISAVVVDERFNELSRYDRIVRPAINPDPSPLLISLTGIDPAEIAAASSFPEVLEDFARYAGAGSLPVVCMNADEAVFLENVRLNRCAWPFAASWHRVRPFAENLGVDLSGTSSGDLHALTPTPIAGWTHNALHDVRSMARWLAHQRRSGTLRSLDQLPTGAPTTDPRSSRSASEASFAPRA